MIENDRMSLYHLDHKNRAYPIAVFIKTNWACYRIFILHYFQDISDGCSIRGRFFKRQLTDSFHHLK